MAKDSGVGKNASYPSNSGKYVRQGQTKSNSYGNNPNVARGNPTPSDLRP